MFNLALELKFKVCFYETQANISVFEILLRNIDEKINIIVEKTIRFHLIPLFKDTMHIWTYGLQMLVIKICI